MPDDIKVYTWLPKGRKFYYAQWVDPLTGRKRTESTKRTTKREADKVAGKLEDDLNNGRRSNRSLTWPELRREYELSAFPAQKEATRRKATGTFDAIEAILGLRHISELTSADIMRFQREIRERDVSEWTVKGHLSIFGKVLRWAKRAGLIDRVVDFPTPKARNAKGRAPTGEEFERMIEATPGVVGKAAAPSWIDTLRKLWWSGLRLAEAEALRFEAERPGDFWINLGESPPLFHICAGLDKTTRDRVFPVAREFAEMLLAIPKRHRKGYVFNPLPWGDSDPDERPSVERIGKTIAIIGEDAGVKVAERKLREPRRQKVRVGEPGARTWGWIESNIVTKHATAHDLRRSFGFRWAMRVLPPVLMELMRHESIQTTQQFYIGRNAAVAAREAWRAADPTKSEVHGAEQNLPNSSPNTSL